MEEQARQAVESSPTRFIVKNSEAKPAWDRTRVFFENYTSRYVLTTENGGKIVLVSNRPAVKDPFLYEVRKSSAKNGVSLEVFCLPRTTMGADLEQAQLNAKNVARFIREGTLELSLLGR